MTLTIGERGVDFSLPAVDGNTYQFSDIAGPSATVVMFWCNHCPYVIAYQDRVIALQAEYAARGVRFAAICANRSDTHPADSFPNMKLRSEQKGYNFPYLHDDTQDVARAFGAQRTPEVFVFDAQRTLKYHGRIDDNHESADQVRSHDLRAALEAILAGQAPDPAETGAVGCTIKWK